MYAGGTTAALHDAVCENDEEGVRMLVESGVDVNKACEDGMFPLNVALLAGYEGVARVLMDAGANVDSVDSFRVDESCRHPVHYAAAGNSLTCLRYILSTGKVKVDTCDYVDATPLHHAAANGHLASVKYLVYNGCDVNHCSKSGRSALWKAAQGGHYDVVKYLVSHGADVNLQNKVSATVLFDLCRKGSIKIAEFLLESGLGVNHLDMSCNTALHIAAGCGKLKSIQLLLKFSVDIDAVNENGNTALHCAATNGQPGAVLELLNHGATYSLLNMARQSAMYLAMLHKNEELVRIFHSNGSKLTRLEHEMYQRYEVDRYHCKERFYKWAVQFFSQPRSLSELSRACIRDQLITPSWDVRRLPVPNVTQKYILLQDFVRDAEEEEEEEAEVLKLLSPERVKEY